MASLESYFEQSRQALASEIEDVQSPDELLRLTTAQIKDLASPDNVFSKSLTLREHRLLTLFLNSVLVISDLVALAPPQQMIAPVVQPTRPASQPRTASVAVAAMTAGATAATTFLVVGPLLTFILSVAIGVLAGLAVPNWTGAQAVEAPVARSSTATSPLVAQISDALIAIGRNFDRLIDVVAEARGPDDSEHLESPKLIEDHPNLLALVHEIMGEFWFSDDRARQITRLSGRILKANGLQAVGHQAGVNDHMFEFEGTGDQVVFSKMLRPALLRDGRLIVKGILSLTNERPSSSARNFAAS